LSWNQSGPSAAYYKYVEIPSETVVQGEPTATVSLTVPAGSYAVSGGCTFHHGDTGNVLSFVVGTAGLESSESVPPVLQFTTQTSVPSQGDGAHGFEDGSANISDAGGMVLNKRGRLTEVCSGPEVGIRDIHIMAIQVANLTGTNDTPA